MVLGLLEQVQIIVAYLPVAGVRSAADDLRFYRLLFAVCFFFLLIQAEIPSVLKQILPRRVIPVQGKPDLQTVNRASPDL